jgi:hypothetical protein
MWQLATIAALTVVALIYWGAEIVRWHAAFQSSEFNAIAAWASVYGVAISFVGLLVSGYAAWGIRQIKTRFLIKARLPVLGKNLQKNASALSDMAEEAPVPLQEKTALFSSIAANLNAVRRHAPKQLRKTQKETTRAFDRLTQQANNAPTTALGASAAFWDTYEKIQLLKNEIDHYLADEKWEN